MVGFDLLCPCNSLDSDEAFQSRTPSGFELIEDYVSSDYSELRREVRAEDSTSQPLGWYYLFP